MIKKNGKTYVVLEFSCEADAAYFETSFFDRAPGDLFEASAQARINDNAFAGQDEVNVTNHLGGVEAGSNVIQAGIVNGGVFGRRVQ